MDLGLPIEGDDWTKTSNPRERKRIQDRLAQRARRARQRQQQESPSSATVLDGNSVPNPSITNDTIKDGDAEALVVEKPDVQGSTIIRSRPIRHSSSLNIDPEAFHLVMRCQTVISALTSNAASIPVYCKIPVPKVLSTTNVQSPPLALMPTALQAEIPHLAFVAALPFAGLRDSILRSLSHIDYDELWRDSVSGGFFIWGSIPWSPQAWEVTEDWARKWWFLLDSEVIETANFWRAQRGLRRLQPASLQCRP